MEKKISSGLKATFLVHYIVGGILGVIYMVIPEIWGTWIGWPVKEPSVYRLVGAAILAFAASSWYAYKETAWEKVKIIIQMEIIWTILGALVMILGMIFAGLPAIGLINAVILAGFALAFMIFYSPKEG